jgi:hypothetical protein
MRATDPGAKRGKAGKGAKRGRARDEAPRTHAKRKSNNAASTSRTSESAGAVRTTPADTLVDRLTGAWGAIVVERIAADQDFADAFERYRGAPRDLRAVFAWDEVLSAEAHLSLVNAIIAKHSDGAGRADPFAILRELHEERRRLAAVYAVNAFRAVLGQMSPRKARWREMEGGDFDERIAVLALAHQALAKALEIARVPAPADLTEPTLDAAQDRAVWAVRRSGPEGLVLAALQAAAVFFARIGADTFADAREVARLYAVQPQPVVAPA